MIKIIIFWLSVLVLAYLLGLAWIIPVDRYPGEPGIPFEYNPDAVLSVMIISIFVALVSILGTYLTFRSNKWKPALYLALVAFALWRAYDISPGFEG